MTGSHTLRVRFSREADDYQISIGHDLLNDIGEWARDRLANSVKIVVVSNPTVFELYGTQVTAGLSGADFDVSHFLLKDGERHKTLRSAESILKFFSEKRISRTDAVVALGGGVVGDVAGFASAVHLRGIPILHVPTTLLSMIDSTVGGKTGVNSAFGKNLIGAFHQPKGVLIDTATLTTLPRRELTAGLCEAVKHGALSGKKLLMQTADLLRIFPPEDFDRFEADKQFHADLAGMIAAQVAFKARIVASDERESVTRTDSRSRKILNFGHTLAHALEKVTNYQYMKHGEAVGYGVLFAAELSKSLALCGEKDVSLLNDVMHRVGPLPSLAIIDEREVLEAFKFDKKNLAGSLQMVLLKGIGKPVIVNEKDIPRSTTLSVLNRLFNKWK